MVLTGTTFWELKDGSKHPTGFWAEEFVVPDRIFREAGLEVTIATPGGLTPVADEFSLAPETNYGDNGKVEEFRVYLADSGENLAAAVALEEADPSEYDIIFAPGGHGPMQDLSINSDIKRIFEATLDDPAKVVASLCHGPASFSTATRDGQWLFKGRRLTAFLDEEEAQVGFADKAPRLLESRLREYGAIFETGPAWGSYVVVDGNLVTGQNPASAGEAVKAVLEPAART
ncbi:type 1 glutamine amidotransferase domain-containing protein [Arthrobacter sp. NPDC058130]|uniref:type 1 glutamine amidotransferase domain-containing protein n=1 Tax=Arthrobacter sp. NPDC058130 TaxID=3346353 RepID=UPI0036E2B67F